MGFSTSGATAVVFLGLLVCASTLYPVLDASHERSVRADEAREERSLARQNTAVSLADVAYNSSGDRTLTVRIDNTGTTTLAVADTSLLVDGEDVAAATTTVDGDPTRTTWAGGERLVATVDRSAVDGPPERVVVVTGNGVTDATEEV
jgi:flagellar protein FlaF